MNKNEEFSIKEFLSIFASKIWYIVIIAVVCASLMTVYSAFIKKDTYTSSSTFYVHKDDKTASSGDITIAQDMGELYKSYIKSNHFLEGVIIELPEKYQNIGLTPAALSGMISFSQVGNTPIYRISVTSLDPEMAYVISDCIEAVTPELIKDGLPNAFSITPVDSPKMPEYANSKNVVRNAIIGGLFGAFATVVVIWLIYAFDVVVHDKKKLTETFEYRVLGEIPSHNISVDVKEESSNAL